MPISPARTAAFDILLKVEREAAYASDLLHSPAYEQLSSQDHGLTTELVMGVLRWRSLLDAEIERFSSQKLQKLDLEVLIALRIAAYQMFALDRVPARAAVNESVDLVKRARKRSAAAFVNALLRKISNHTDWIHDFQKALAELHNAPDGSGPESTVVIPPQSPTPQGLHSMADRYAHPWWVVERWVDQYGWQRAREICRYDQQVPATAVRLPDAATKAGLEKAGVILLNGAVLKSAGRVEKGDLARTAAFREGRVVIQDEASQLIAVLLGQGEKILDCCAAPGGKTRVIAERNPDAAVVAVELHPHRARLLRRRVPAKNVEVITADVRNLGHNSTFDRVLADVPCSGTGTLARHPEIKWRLKLEDLRDLQSRELAILESAMRCVSPGGRLLYSTCSLETEENESVIEQVLANNPAFHVIDAATELERLRGSGELVWNDIGSLTSGPYVRTIPGVHPCDGLFAAKLEKV